MHMRQPDNVHKTVSTKADSRQRRSVVTVNLPANKAESTYLSKRQIAARLMPMGILLLALYLTLLPKPAWSDAITDLHQSSFNAAGGLDSTVPPEQPEMIYPKPGDTSVDLIPRLLSSDFVDNDLNDRHLSTQWLIETSHNGHVVMDTICRNHHLRDLQIPQHILSPQTSYRVQVRYYDVSDLPSSWSEPVAFTTAVNPLDANNDGIPDSQEIDFFIDLNQDGIDDSDQSNLIRSIRTHDDRFHIGVSVDNSASNIGPTSASSVNPKHLPEPFYSPEEMAYGLLGYRIIVKHPGQKTAVTIHLSEPIDPAAPWLRYDSVMGWEEITDTIQTNANGMAFTRQLIDGGLGDADGVANGIIVDLCGPLTVDSASISDSEGNASGATDSTMCFIQTIRKNAK